ncbi:replication initiation protein (plasmid) [Parabacteroides distasonis]|nr:replication initiation protein [Parabacteroides distasonis]
MEKKDKKQRDIVLSQDNALTTARYKFDLIEKRALYSIIRNIRAQYIENENGRRDLFDDLIITIHEEELKKCGDNTKMQNIYDALKRLRNRDIEINNEKMWLSIGFVNYVKHIKNKSYFEVQVSKEVLPYYVELAQNFTSYSMTVAIALKSTFSQRFYELCCQYRNAGFFFYTVEKLREMFMLEKKYKRGCDFKRRVLDDPQRSCTMPDNAIYTSSSSQRATKARKLPNTNSTFTQGKPNNKSYWNTKAQNRRSST